MHFVTNETLRERKKLVIYKLTGKSETEYEIDWYVSDWVQIWARKLKMCQQCPSLVWLRFEASGELCGLWSFQIGNEWFWVYFNVSDPHTTQLIETWTDLLLIWSKMTLGITWRQWIVDFLQISADLMWQLASSSDKWLRLLVKARIKLKNPQSQKSSKFWGWTSWLKLGTTFEIPHPVEKPNDRWAELFVAPDCVPTSKDIWKLKIKGIWNILKFNISTNLTQAKRWAELLVAPDCCSSPKVLLRYFLAINSNPTEARFGIFPFRLQCFKMFSHCSL